MFCLYFRAFPAEAYSEPCQTSKMERFAKIINSFQPLTTFAKRSILDVWQGSEFASREVNDLDIEKILKVSFFE